MLDMKNSTVQLIRIPHPEETYPSADVADLRSRIVPHTLKYYQVEPEPGEMQSVRLVLPT